MTSKILSAQNHAARLAFISNYNRLATRSEVQPSSLENRLCRAFYRRGKMIAGYAINHKAPFHYLRYVPEPKREELLTKGRCVEVIHTWIESRDGSMRPIDKTQFYLRAFLDCFSHRPRYILGGTLNPQLRAYQMQLFTTLLDYGTLVSRGKRRNY